MARFAFVDGFYTGVRWSVRHNGREVDFLRQLLVSESPNARLDRAALDLARIQFPDLEHQPVLDQMNEIAANLGDRLRNFNDGRDFVEKAQSYLFGGRGSPRRGSRGRTGSEGQAKGGGDEQALHGHLDPL